MVNAMQYEAFLGVGVFLFDSLVYLKANYQSVTPFQIQIQITTEIKT
jgi:hypothetical protein